MNSRANQIGFSQRVRLEWLEMTANLVLAGNDKLTINATLQEHLQDKVSIDGEAVRGNREKIITILMKVWFNTPPELESLRADGLDLLRQLPRPDHLAVHWGMVMAVYPFWAAVAGHAGRFLKLQGSVRATHVQRRLREQYGERETVSRAARRILRSFIDWGVLCETKTQGVYTQGPTMSIADPRLAAWLIEAFLHTRANGCAPLQDLVASPGLFPFHLEHLATASLLAASPRLDLLRHGLDDELVMLRLDIRHS
ncbi:hypothetical protein SDD30_00650 [Moorella naiadis]|uniref:hypothetical protein n=1 Tax=Moorella naiadis (nom. illeg.) TaxID=3093670 RepID=UPI003D9CA4D8